MLALLSGLIPVCLAAAVSPMMLSEQTLLMAGPGGRRAGAGYALGTATVILGVALLALSLGRHLQLPTAPKLTAGSDIGLGLLLIAVGGVMHLLARRPHRQKRPKQHGKSAAAAYGFGFFSMATNFTTLPLVLSAAKDISASGQGMPGAVAGLTMLAAFACLPAWAPLAVVTVSPTGGAHLLADVKAFVDKHGHALAMWLTVAAGLYLIARGLIRFGVL